jgi:ribosome-associated heat shock protein Hsp15
MVADVPGTAGEAPVRVDRWLWSVRLCSTRSAATDLCRAGHVKVNGRAAKPATTVGPGDEVAARIGTRDRLVEVVRPIEKRVGAPIAIACYVDRSPVVDTGRDPELPRRERGAGRPTKRDRRDTDRLRGRR